ncbi:phosphotransferase [Ornithinimicrobium cryptoxanthini]|uniref:phosphotransferase n=1 Tax=Ornithinimicrobium cryptoxanthini TaxID=2934161 RepID=UPI0021183F23|nr:phosphotransferase [Ornithinimicrobium cryptoxanthini]
MSVTTSRASRAVPVSGRVTADLLIDSARLSELLGRPARATRLRHKPGLSTTAALIDPTGEQPPGWVQVTHPEHQDKLSNALRRAGERGQQVHLRDVPEALAPGRLQLAWGGFDTDPRLQSGLDTVRVAHPDLPEAVRGGRLTVLRYNPHRRLVLHRPINGCQPLVLRVTAHRQRYVQRNLARLAAAGVPLVAPLATHGLERTRRVSVWPWFGEGDLQHRNTNDAPPAEIAALAHEAGEALARVHHTADLIVEDSTEPRKELQRLRRDLGHCDPAAGERMDALNLRVLSLIDERPWARGTLHGDFSADQVLIATPGTDGDRIALIDFDRISTGPLARDLGSFAAHELLNHPVTGEGSEVPGELSMTAALLQGYAVSGRAWSGRRSDTTPDGSAEHDLRTWTAHALLLRVLEPFRAAEPAWLGLIHQRLDQIEEILR